MTRRWLLGTLTTVAVLALAEAVGRTGLVDEEVLPLASTVLDRAAELAADPDFVESVVVTLGMWGAGMLIAIGIAVPLGLVLGSLPALEGALRPIVEFLRPLPSVALIPLALLAFGDNTRMTVVLVTYACAWPVLIHTIYGLQEVEPLAKDTLRAFGFGGTAVALRVSLPSAAPFIATGIRVAAGIGLIVVISVELVAGGGEGLGSWVASTGQGVQQTHSVLAAIVWVGVLSLVLDGLLTWTKRRLFGWHQGEVS